MSFTCKSTMFSGYSDSALFSMFRSDSWSSISKETKLQLCQEVVNRDAKATGMTYAPTVSFSKLDAATLGEQSGKCIFLNEDHFANGVAYKQVGNELVEVKLADNNMQALTTLFHENQHAYQNQIINGEIEPANKAAAIEYKANDFTVSHIEINGKQTQGLQYLRGETNGNAGYYLYYLQSTERDAFRLSEMKAANIREFLAAKHGDEPSFVYNREAMKLNGFDAQLENAKNLFGNQNIEREINTALINSYYGTNYSVSPEIDNMVKNEMKLSLNSMGNSNETAEAINNNAQANSNDNSNGLSNNNSDNGLSDSNMGSDSSNAVDSGMGM